MGHYNESQLRSWVAVEPQSSRPSEGFVRCGWTGYTNSMTSFEPTDEQRDVLDHPPTTDARVLAGPGTGKSATVVAWIERLLSDPEPPRVKLLTFTRAATGELAKKVSEHPHLASQRPGTIHSFSISVLLRNSGVGEFPEPLRLADDWENDKIIYPTLGHRISVPTTRVRRLFQELASAWESLAPAEDPKVTQAERARFLAAWQEHRRILGYTLLSELPFALRNALRDHPDLEGADYDILIVDEYQDLNACDLEVLRLISERGCRIVGVGDDDQSIYSFRKAHPEGIRRFPTDYPGCADYPLSITHRCGSRIIAWASFVIEGDLSRSPDKRRLTPKEGSPPGEVALLSFAGHVAEPRGIATLVEKLVNEEGLKPEDVLVLLRSDRYGHFSAPIKAALQAKRIPCSNPEYVAEVLGEDENRRLLAVLRLLINRTDSLAWATLFKLTRGIGNAFISHIYEFARSRHGQFGEVVVEEVQEDFVGAPPASRNRAKALVNDVLRWIEAQEVPESTPDDGWSSWIGEISQDNPISTLRPDLEELLNGIEELVEIDSTLDRYLGQIRPLAKDKAQNELKGVRIMTMSASKGLTVEAAILGGLEEGIIPREDAQPEEERRLLYVAMTRSKRFLFGTWARRRRGPTARAGRARVGDRRNLTHLLEGGPVGSENGESYILNRWG